MRTVFVVVDGRFDNLSGSRSQNYTNLDDLHLETCKINNCNGLRRARNIAIRINKTQKIFSPVCCVPLTSWSPIIDDPNFQSLRCTACKEVH